MSRTVVCSKYKTEMEGLPNPPMPGAKGQKIFESVSAKAWKEWLQHQTMLINEKQLNMLNPNTRSYLSEQMDKFLSGEQHDQVEGYVPPEQ